MIILLIGNASDCMQPDDGGLLRIFTLSAAVDHSYVQGASCATREVTLERKHSC